MNRRELNELLTRIYEDGHTLLILMVAVPMAALLILIALGVSDLMFWVGIPLLILTILMALRLFVIEIESRRREWGLPPRERRELYQAASFVLIGADVGIAMGQWGQGAQDAWIVWVFVGLFLAFGVWRLLR